MPKPKIDQLDPFNEHKDEYKSNEIRHSRSREIHNLFVKISPDKKHQKVNFKFILLAVVAGLALAAVIILVTPKPNPSSNPPSPTGTSGTTSGGQASNYDDPAIRASEQEKLASLNALIEKQDWQYANALLKTIYPDYLDTCDKYSYYQAMLAIADNFDHELSRDTIVERADFYKGECESEN